MQYRIRNGDRLITTIGNRNLLKGTQNWQGNWSNVTPNVISKDSYRGLTVFYTTTAWYGPTQFYEAKPSTTYTFSFYAKASEVANIMDIMTINSEDWNSPVVSVPIYENRAITTDWQRYSITFTTKGGGKLAPNTQCMKNGPTIYLAGYKLEEGSVATPWSPAPEDYGITDHSNAYRVTGLAPSTTYQFSVAAFNGLRESPKGSITVRTRGLRVNVPTQLPMNATYSLTYEEYALGLVPIGNEPAGMFGGGNKQVVPAKVISSGSTSVLEITNSFNLMNDGLAMKQLPDGSFATYQGYKALFLQRKE